MSRHCKTGLFFLRWITADPTPWGSFTPPTKHERGEILEDLEPVYDLFTIMSEIIPSVSLSRVTYTGINSMHSQKTKQPYIRSTRKNRTRKKKSAVEDPQKSPKKINKKQALWIAEINRITKDKKALEQTWKKKELSISKKPWKLLRTEPLKTGIPEKANKWMDLTMP